MKRRATWSCCGRASMRRNRTDCAGKAPRAASLIQESTPPDRRAITTDQFRAIMRTNDSRKWKRIFERTENALFIWEALYDIVIGDVVWSAESGSAWKCPHRSTQVPNWILWYLLRGAGELQAMGRGHASRKKLALNCHSEKDVPARRKAGITPPSAIKQLPRVMWLSRRGWNAFKDFRARQLSLNAAAGVNFDCESTPLERKSRWRSYLAPRRLRRP
jgi:hypothetical protein